MPTTRKRVTGMGALVFWLVVVAVVIGSTIVARHRRARRIAAYAASAELRGTNLDGHERSNGAIAAGTAWTQGQQSSGMWG